MPGPSAKAPVTAVEHLSRFVKAMALGVLCAGLLLLDKQIDLASFIDFRQDWLARLVFLLWIGISFGTGAALAKIL